MVLFVTYSGELGGAERLLLDFACAVEEETVIACPEGPLADAGLAAGLRAFRLRSRRANLRASVRDRALAPARLAGHGIEIRRLIAALNPDLLVLWSMRSALAGLLGRRLRCTVAFHQNDLLPGPAIARLVRAAAARADLVTASSRAAAADLDPAGRLGSALQVVHPGVDIGRFATARPPAQPPEIVVLGALAASKQPDLALDAVAVARRTRPDVRLRLIGAPFDEGGRGLEQRLRVRASQADLAGAVEFAGAVPDPREDILRATCLLHCSPREAFGMAVLEALAAGRPAIVPDAFGPPEIVDRASGLLYPPGDALSAGAAIASLVEDPGRAAAMGAAGRERAKAHFDLRAARRRYAEAIAPLLERVQRRRSVAPGTFALVTVTHNSADELGALLTSVRRHLASARVVVVDCRSEDETLEIARSHEGVEVVVLGENIGFGRACNRGLARVHEPVCVLINPDVELIDCSLVTLAAEAMRRDRPERLLAPLVLYGDGTRQDSVHPTPGMPADLVRALVPLALLPRQVRLPLAPWDAYAPRRVGWAIGCAIVARTETLRRLGPFDERIFMYGEDLELGLRAGQAGVKTWFWPSGRVIHHRAHSTGPAFGGEPFERLARARHEVVLRRLGQRAARRDDFTQALTFGSRIVAKRMLGRSTARERRQLSALRHVRRADGRT